MAISMVKEYSNTSFIDFLFLIYPEVWNEKKHGCKLLKNDKKGANANEKNQTMLIRDINKIKERQKETKIWIISSILPLIFSYI